MRGMHARKQASAGGWVGGLGGGLGDDGCAITGEAAWRERGAGDAVTETLDVVLHCSSAPQM